MVLTMMKWIYFVLIFIVGTATGFSNDVSASKDINIIKENLKVGSSTTDYKVRHEILLMKSLHGINGKLQLLEDVRITDKTRHAIDYEMSTVFMSNSDIQGSEDDKIWRPFKKLPPKDAILRIVDNQGKVIDSRTLERAFAWLKTVKLYPSNKPTYLLTVDYSTGLGTYNGPITFPVEVIGGQLQWLEAIDNKTGQKEKISLEKTGKADWKFFKSINGKDVLKVSCYPRFENNFENMTFMVRYLRYHFDGKRWLKLEREEKGFWESDRDFPNLSLFP